MRAVVYCLVATVCCLAACDRQPEDPRARIEVLMESAEHAAEEGDADALALILHTDYRDAYGRDRRAMVFMLRSLLRRYPRMEVAARDMEIEMLSPQLAKVELTVVAVARNRDRPLRAAFDADQRRLRLAMRADGDLWYVTRAEWRLAGLD